MRRKGFSGSREESEYDGEEEEKRVEWLWGRGVRVSMRGWLRGRRKG